MLLFRSKCVFPAHTHTGIAVICFPDKEMSKPNGAKLLPTVANTNIRSKAIAIKRRAGHLFNLHCNIVHTTLESGDQMLNLGVHSIILAKQND